MQNFNIELIVSLFFRILQFILCKKINLFMDVRVRFAPSPTGYLHVGGLRTALYNYLFAKHHKGKMILRIEDTDRSRFVENATENLMESLKWAGVIYDEGPDLGGDYGPYMQSQRLDLYKKYAQQLIDLGKAYYAFDTSDELAEMRQRQGESFDPKYKRQEMKNQFTLGDQESKKIIESGADYVVRLLSPIDEELTFEDIIRGEITVSTNDIDDQILIKSDGYPTYHLANVVDDHLMKISHVIRGEEWLPSTPKHVLLYNSFNWESPKFAHLPLLLNKDKSKLSKRQGSVAVEDYMQKGYLKDAFINFIALLGWNPSGDREIYSMDEFIEFFNLEKVNKAGAVFDVQKLDWMNQQYIKQSDSEFLAETLSISLQNLNIDISKDYAIKLVNLFKERITFVDDILTMAPYMFSDKFDYDVDYFKKRWNDSTNDLLEPLLKKYEESDDFTHHGLHGLTKEYVESIGKKIGDIIHPIRLMITGKSSGAGMFETMEVLGKDECLNRFKFFYQEIYQKLKDE